MEFIISILANIVAAPFIFAGGIFYERRLRKAIVLWRSPWKRWCAAFSEGRKPIVVYGYVMPKTIDGKPHVEQGDLLCLLRLAKFLDTNFSGSTLFYDSYEADLNFDQFREVICVSGPKWNILTRYYLGEIGSPFFFSTERKSTERRNAKGSIIKEYKTIYGNGGEIKVCYCMIVSAKHMRPDGTMQPILICAGRSTFSTNAAVYFLEAMENSAALLRATKKFKSIMEDGPQQNWSVLLRVHNTGANPNPVYFNSREVRYEVADIALAKEFLPAYAITGYSGEAIQ